jgi:hypothetical protein
MEVHMYDPDAISRIITKPRKHGYQTGVSVQTVYPDSSFMLLLHHPCKHLTGGANKGSLKKVSPMQIVIFF